MLSNLIAIGLVLGGVISIFEGLAAALRKPEPQPQGEGEAG